MARVMLVINTLSGAFGGTEGNTLDFAAALARYGDSPVVVQVGKRVVDERAAHLKVPVEHVDTDDFLAPTYRFWRQLLSKRRPDVIVFAKNWYDTRSGKLDLAALLGGIRRVVWENHPAPRLYEDYWGKPFSFYWLRRRFASFLHFQLAAKIVAVSEAVRGPITEQFLWSDSGAEVVYPGVDFDVFRPDAAKRQTMREQWGIQPHQLVVGAVGRLVPEKGYGMMLSIAAKLKAELPDRFVCVFCGEGPDRQRLEKLAVDLDIADSTRFTGWVESSVEAWQAIDIAVLPSRNEGLGMALIESAAAGAIPLGSNHEGMREVLFGELAHLALPLGDEPAWQRKLKSLIGLSDADRLGMNEQICRSLRQRFDSHQQWHQLRQQVLSE